MYATLNGVRTFYTVQGTGPTLICVHGGPGMSDHRGYERWMAPLTDAYQLVLYDLRGCGESGEAPDNSYSHDDFTTIINLEPGMYRFRFLVDGQYRCSSDFPTVLDSQGNLLNYVEVSKHLDNLQDLDGSLHC